ncbi:MULTISPECIES: anthrax toxin lethal factor-related metalloendopeptidase [unclassified Corallococcus]|uniref:anthrax toxin lethal factor-related metalloendopeptidase n=1 Tax=unclassified Corallococcus TaxID=2685029 RepID=UPI001A8EF57E|nr:MULTISPECIES: hypothetical protein [unclassified Corallococcus]MBN9686958.1 hypothetical protein [Corallococcus sp. NCSPR001]WAS89211.1 hypothetical protein O0N60_20055 [Corallococcus sp. NCRR]
MSSIARSITKTGGSGTSSDVELVVPRLEKWTTASLFALEKQGTQVVVCRGSVTDYVVSLKGVRPRGWPPGSTWDSVPGLHKSETNEVVIAIIGHAAKKPHVPRLGEGHGSYDLVVHESAHAVDKSGGATKRSASPAFTQARKKDLATLSAYEKQSGSAGPEETWAESAARYFGKDPKDAKAHPNLHGFWASNPVK